MVLRCCVSVKRNDVTIQISGSSFCIHLETQFSTELESFTPATPLILLSAVKHRWKIKRLAVKPEFFWWHWVCESGAEPVCVTLSRAVVFIPGTWLWKPSKDTEWGSMPTPPLSCQQDLSDTRCTKGQTEQRVPPRIRLKVLEFREARRAVGYEIKSEQLMMFYSENKRGLSGNEWNFLWLCGPAP